ncbi:MAG: hypothetical protein K5644_02905 [Lachnospiraceae bacterium]|nr:hypothetical protein [Lachnospiraceae bacterium]
MSNSEDYLDGLLNSISQKKSSVENALDEDQKNIQAKIADMSSLDPGDDFMDATGISDFKPKKMSHDNLRQAFSESDFLRDFENELSSGTADDFIEEFEREIDDEEARFQRGEEIPEDKGTEFIRALMEEEGGLEGADGEEDEINEASDSPESDNDSISSDANDDNLESSIEDTFVTIDDSYLDNPDANAKADIDPSVEEQIEQDGSSSQMDSSDNGSEDDAGDNASDDSTSAEGDSDNIENASSSNEVLSEADELLSAIGEGSSEAEADSSDGASEDESGKDAVEEAVDAQQEAKDNLKNDVANNEDIQNILDEVANIVSDDEEKDDESILPKEYQSDEHDSVDALEVNEDGVSLVDENADLDALLEGEEGMSDIGDLLDADENDIELDESRDAFEASVDKAENATQSQSEGDASEGGEKVGFIQKILNIFKKKKKEDPEEAANELLNVAAGGGVEDTSDENQRILEEMDEEDAASLDAKQKKAEEKAEKKAAKKAAKAEKKAAKKAEKDAKPKKEKKPSALKTFLTDDKSKKIPMKVIIIFVLFVVTIIVGIILLSNIYSKRATMSEANSYYAAGNYVAAYNCLSGVSGLNESETETLNKARILADLQNKKAEYDTFMQKKDYENALDALIVAVGRYNENLEQAKELGVNAEYNGIESMIVGQLKDQFGMTDEEATQLYAVKGRTKYTVALNDKLQKLGMSNSGSNN